jgi:hypothetical protein
MKAKLTFNLPEEQDDFNHAIKGVDYYLVLTELDNKLRNIVKYGGDGEWKGKEDAAELMRKELNLIILERGINIYD